MNVVVSSIARTEAAVQPLASVATVILGQSPPSQTYNPDGVGLPFLQGKAEFGPTSPTPLKWCSAPQKVAPAGATLVSVRAPVGDANLADREYCIGRGLTALVPGPSLDPRYLYFWLASKREYLASLGTGSTFQSINGNVLRELLMPVPPLDEQSRIARILSVILDCRDRSRETHRASESLRVSLIADLIGQAMSASPTVRLGEIAKVGNGSTPKRDEVRYWTGGTVPWLTSGKIHERQIASADEFVTNDALAECHLPIVAAGSVLVAITGQGKTLGNVACLNIDACVNQHLAYITPDARRIRGRFLYYYLGTQYNRFREIAFGGGSTKGALTCSYLASLPVPVPELDLQDSTIGALAAADHKVVADRVYAESVEQVLHAASHSLVQSA